MRVAVIGLGKLGLPLAVQYASKGASVTGVDINPEVVDSVNTGTPHFPGEPDLAEKLQTAIKDGTFTATGSMSEAVEQADIIVVVVPLLVDRDGNPAFDSIDAVTVAIGASLHQGQLVIFETTLPIGTTRGRFSGILERESSLIAGDDFLVVFSPERVASGTIFRDLRRYPKIVGGINQASTDAAIAFYQAVLEFDDRDDLDRPNGVWDVGSCEAAEFVKLAETTYRDVNIALANEFAEHAEDLGLDYSTIAVAANSQPYSHLHGPGIAVGGHCIPVYPRLYMANHHAAVLPKAAREVNESQPERAVARLEATLGSLEGLTVVVLGAAYRGGVKETAFSGVFPLVEALKTRGATPVVHDPLFTPEELETLELQPYVMGTPIDAAIVQTNHADYSVLDVVDLPGLRAIVDGRAILNLASFRRNGVAAMSIGDGMTDRSPTPRRERLEQ